MAYKKVKLIEKSPLPLDQRVEVLLVYANQKPATILYIENRNYFFLNNYFASKINTPFEKRLKKVQKLLDRLNISYETSELEKFGGHVIYSDGTIRHLPLERVLIYMARTHDKKDKLMTASFQGDDYGQGRLFGFPETAIQAFHGERNRFMGDLDHGNPQGYFTQFVFSQEFFDEEYKSTSIRWHDTVKRLSPRMYEQIRNRNLR